MAWKIWFDDGSTFSSDDGSADQSPNRGVVCIESGQAKAVVKGSDWYFLHPKNGWLGTDIHGLLYMLCNDKDSMSCVRQGAIVQDDVFAASLKAAKKGVAKIGKA